MVFTIIAIEKLHESQHENHRTFFMYGNVENLCIEGKGLLNVAHTMNFDLQQLQSFYLLISNKC